MTNETEKRSMTSSEIITEQLKIIDRAFGGKQTNERLKIYREHLSQLNVSMNEIIDGVDSCIHSETHFPSISTVVTYINAKRSAKEVTDHFIFKKKEDLDMFKREEVKLKQVGKFFGEDVEKKKKYIQYWAKVAYGENFKNDLADQGLNVSVFEKPALFDLMDNNYKLENLEQVIKRNNARAWKNRA